MRPLNLAGRVFSRLTVQARIGSRHGKSLWRCRCSCDAVVEVTACHLVSGAVTSCGCRKAEGLHRSHEKSHWPEYRSWSGAKSRCLNPRNPDWPHYGGRNIRVCRRWLRSFQNFLNDMGCKPSAAHSLDRIDVNRGYKAQNCRWATPSVQVRNRRRIRRMLGGRRVAMKTGEGDGIAQIGGHHHLTMTRLLVTKGDRCRFNSRFEF